MGDQGETQQVDADPEQRMFDLSSMTQLQKQYVVDLKAIDMGGAENPVNTVNNSLNAVHDTLKTANVSSDHLLLKQDAVNNILETENSRLEEKKANIEDAIHGQKRLININKSYTLRYNAFNKILYAIIIGTLLFILWFNLERIYRNIIPAFIFNLLLVLIISFTIIFIFYVLLEMSTREKLNYNKLKLQPPPKTGANDYGDKTNLSKTMDMDLCKGEECCPKGQQGAIWDAATGLCTLPVESETNADSQDTFTNLEKNVKSYTPSEFTDYAKI